MLQKIKENKAITLIALIITIIILLILAGVSIAMLTGENGILTKTNNAKIETIKSEINEKRKLTIAEANINLNETEYIDINNKKVKIPPYSAVSQVIGENTVDNGLVIIDKNGNEWVWIDVPNDGTGPIYPINATDEQIEQALKNYTVDYTTPNLDVWYDVNGKKETDLDCDPNNNNGCGLTLQEYKKLKSKMLQSIQTNAGFYIGRYETGTEKENRKSHTTEFQKAVIKQDVYPYIYVSCTEAQQIANTISLGEKKAHILFGIQWDLICKFIEKAKTKAEIKTNSLNWGNYRTCSFDITRGEYAQGYENSTFNKINQKYIKEIETQTLLTTGATDRNSAMNIYDFAGNVWEYTLAYISCHRGGDYNNLDWPASSFLIVSNTSYVFCDLSFRVSIY